VPKIKDFQKCCDNGFSEQQIKTMERLILRKFTWQVLSPSRFIWINWLMHEWDNFIKNVSYSDQLLLYKDANEDSYRRYREVMQMLDVCSLDPRIRTFPPSDFASALFYVYTSKFLYESGYLMLGGDPLEGPAAAHELITTFLVSTMKLLGIECLTTAMTFVQEFLDFPIQFDMPTACQVLSKEQIEQHYEEFLCYQTHHSGNLEFIAEIFRNTA
jgi:hypothetical protein